MNIQKREKSAIYPPIPFEIKILLAEDDHGDRLIFEEVLEELPVNANLKIVGNGEELIHWLHSCGDDLPDVLYLDLQMPRKNGLAALSKIKRNFRFEGLPVFIITSLKNEDIIKRAYMDAAHYCIYKPMRFEEFKSLVYKSLKIVTENELSLPRWDNFILTLKEEYKDEFDS